VKSSSFVSRLCCSKDSTFKCWIGLVRSSVYFLNIIEYVVITD
jgi:hypothetical protein